MASPLKGWLWNLLAEPSALLQLLVPPPYDSSLSTSAALGILFSFESQVLFIYIYILPWPLPIGEAMVMVPLFSEGDSIIYGRNCLAGYLTKKWEFLPFFKSTLGIIRSDRIPRYRKNVRTCICVCVCIQSLQYDPRSTKIKPNQQSSNHVYPSEPK